MDGFESYEKLLKKQVESIHKEAGNEYVSQSVQDINAGQKQTQRVSESFLTAQASSQKSFYDEYKENWKTDYEGEKVFKSAYTDPVDLRIQQENLSFFQKKGRKKLSNDQIESFKSRMHFLGAGGVGIDVEKQKAGTGDLMCSNLRLAAINKKKDEIIDEEMLKADKKNLILIGKYLPFLRDLGPELSASMTDDINDEVHISERSIKDYTAFIRRAFKNPVVALNESINDAVHGYGKISTKILEKKVIPKRFETIKQLRDKYKAVHDIMRSPINDPKVMDSISKIKQNVLLKDNVAFATEMYRRLDADLCYAMEENSLSFTSDTFLDRYDKEGGQYATKGDLTLKTIMEQKNMVKDQDKEDNVDTYWRSQISSELLKIRFKKDVDSDKPKKAGEEKEEKKKGKIEDKKKAGMATADINDGRDIIATADKIAQEFDTTDDEKQNLFGELKDNVKNIASAITDINHELIIARHILEHKGTGDDLLRPELLRRIPWYVATRQQQLLNLMDRVAGYLNAMRYLTGKAKLNANGAQVIKSEKDRQTKKAKDDGSKGFGFINIDQAVVDISSKGPGKDIVTLNTPPKTFEQFKENIKKELTGTGAAYERLAKILDSKDASLHYDFLILEGKKLESMKLADLQTAFEEKSSTTKRLDALIKSITDCMEETDILYARLKNGGIYALSDEEKNDIVDRAMELKKKQYAINRIRGKKSGDDGKGLTYNTLAITKMGKSKKHNFKSEDLNKIKYKVIFDQLEQYRCQAIADQVRIGTAGSELYTENEKKDIEARLKSNKVVDDKTKDGRSKDFIILEYFLQKNMEAANLASVHQGELDEYLLKNKQVKTLEDKKKEFIDKAIELEERQAKEKFEKKKEEIKAEKERKQKDNEENEKKLKEQKEKEEKEAKEKEAKEKEEKEKLEKEKKEQKEKEEKEDKKEKEEKKEEIKEETKEIKDKKDTEEDEDVPKNGELYVKAKNLKKKYTTSVSKAKQNMPYSDRDLKDPITDNWAHSFASLINDKVGRFVVDGKMILEDKDMKDKEVFGPERNKIGEPTDYVDLLNKYVPNTAIAKTTFESQEFMNKNSFLSFVKKTLDTTKSPVLLKRKGGFVTVYGISKDNQLLCKRSATEDSSEMYTENPDEVFDNVETNGDVSLYWLQEVDKDKNVKELKDDKQQVEYKVPEEVIDEKEAAKKIKALKTLDIADHEPEPLKVKKTVVVQDKLIHEPYENQDDTLYCWACAMNGMINYLTGKKTSELWDVMNYKYEVPAKEDTRIKTQKDYDNAVNELEAIQTGSKVGNPMIFADYILEKVPGTAVRSIQINNTPGKTELCKRRFKEELSMALEKGPVGLLRNNHFILVYELNGDRIKAKDSLRKNPDDIEADRFTVDKLYDPKECNGNIELVYLENIKGHEKELTAEFDDLTYDEKTKEFRKNNQDDESRKPSGAETMLHKKGIEANDRKPYDVVNKSVYVPLKM